MNHRALPSSSHDVLEANVATLTIDEAPFHEGGCRSIVAALEHVGRGADVYRCSAFDAEPRHWEDTSRPRGVRSGRRS